ncbi:MAG: PSD1 domain-containing protein [Bryobacterales bacterium]|nr:PSD1 domain-containing protein [Bryobacterales bacterium]
MRLVWLGLVYVMTLCAQEIPPAATRPVEFEKDIQPLLRKRCLACHNGQISQNGVRLDDGAAALAGGYSGPVILPGKSAESKMVIRAASNKKGFMMPPMGPNLTADEVGILRAWIDQGAKWPAKAAAAKGPPKQTHWAYLPVTRPAVPEVRNRAWVRNPVDRFVLARLEREGIEPSTEASKATLVRRVTLDLTGLPPAPEEVAQFLADNRTDAYEQLVERLLASPHYGEARARPWLDLARYADSDGYEKDQVRPYAWRYRSWVIDAFNEDKPFDQFTIEQLAGDLLPGATIDQKIATGFQRNALTNREAGVDRAEARFEQLVNRTSTVGTVWLGQTVGCAQCHNHKYDPITQKDFYQLMAFFNRADDEDILAPVAGEMGAYLRERPEYERRRAELFDTYKVEAMQEEWEKQMVATMDTPGKDLEWDFWATSMRAMVDHAERSLRTPKLARTALDAERITYYFINNPGPANNRDKEKMDCFRDLRRRLGDLDSKYPKLSQAMTLAENPKPTPAYIAVRGDYREKGIPVEPDTPGFLPPLPAKEGANRLALARWLVAKDNPLTARVTVNRFWQELFGRGLVRTSEDFGTQGERPSHPELLDWLANDFTGNGWSVKHLIRTIVLSATYRQSSDVPKDLAEKDPDNALLARQSRVRLTAEQVRDAALEASGLLDTRIGGPSVRPPQPAGLDALGYGGSVKWRESEGPDRYRRGLYIFFQRTVPYPQLMNFDAPDSNVTCSRRRRSNTPLQALNLLNDPVFVEAAQALAVRLLQEPSPDRLERAFLLTLGRKPTARERERLRKFLDEQASGAAKNEAAAATLVPFVPEGRKVAETYAWTGVSRVLLNLDEFITKE